MHSEVTVDRRVGKILPGQGDVDPAGLIEKPTHGSHLGQRSSDRTAKAGHMTASDLSLPNADSACQAGAIHTWPGHPRRDKEGHRPSSRE